MLANAKAVFFDFDGVILDTEWPIYQTWLKLLSTPANTPSLFESILPTDTTHVAKQQSLDPRNLRPKQYLLRMRAHVLESSDRKAVVHGELIAENQVTATCEGIFVAVKEGHPAFHRW